MSQSEVPQPPYVLLFEEVVPGALPLAVLVDDRGAVPLFGSEEGAAAFAASAGFGAGLEPVEVSRSGLIRALQSVEEKVDYVALNPPPANEGGMRVTMGSLGELVEALRTAGRGDDLFDLGSAGSSG